MHTAPAKYIKVHSVSGAIERLFVAFQDRKKIGVASVRACVCVRVCVRIFSTTTVGYAVATVVLLSTSRSIVYWMQMLNLRLTSLWRTGEPTGGLSMMVVHVPPPTDVHSEWRLPLPLACRLVCSAEPDRMPFVS